MKTDLCKAFCDNITVTEVPVGLAVSTAFRRSDGDAITFYVVHDAAKPGIAHIEDDGETVPYLEACGVDFSTQTRQEAFRELLTEHGADYDDEEAIVRTPQLPRNELPAAAPCGSPLSFSGCQIFSSSLKSMSRAASEKTRASASKPR